MEHELKIIYKFDPNKQYIPASHIIKIYLDGEQLGAIKNISFKCDADIYDREPPNITINYGINSNDIKNFDYLKSRMVDIAIKLSKLKIIKSDILETFKKYINLKAFL